MAHYGLLGRETRLETTEDIRGTTLYGLNDEKLGKIDDVIFDHSTAEIRYVVVDTGGWLKTKKFIVPASRLRASVEHENDFTSGLTKEQIEAFPPYDDRDLESQDKWEDYEGRYRSQWETGPIQHRTGTDRNITPTTQQMRGNQSSIRAEEGKPGREARNAGVVEEPVDEAVTSTRVVPAGTDSVVIASSAVGIGGRWDTFQARLRERRKKQLPDAARVRSARRLPEDRRAWIR